jgi:Carboxypeptidase regulatory-like domain/Outer membrane protein beta-barrel family
MQEWYTITIRITRNLFQVSISDIHSFPTNHNTHRRSDMKRQWYKFLSLPLLLAVLSLEAFAGNGKINGTVKGADGDPAVGANVTVEGTTLGASADVTGSYFILNVPPGTYRVRASAVGYTPQVITNVRVASDQIVALDFTLPGEAVGMEEVVVEAVRPPIDRSQTSARTTIGGDDFTSLPISDVSQLVATSASTYKGFLRGGRQFETKTIVDGIDLTDQFYRWASDGPGGSTPYASYNGVQAQDQAQNASLVDLNLSSVEEANVLTGGIGSDYNSATAGVIAYSLREGRGAWSGRANFRISQTGGLKHFGPDIYWDEATYFATKATLAASADPASQAKAQRFTWTRDKYSYGEKPEINGEVALGGAVDDNLGLYFTGSYFDSHGRLPNEHKRKLNSSLKLNYNFSPDMKLNFTGLLEDRGKLFGWKNSNYVDDFRFFLEGVPQYDGATLVGALKWTHVLSPKTFYEVQVSVSDDNKRTGYSDDNNNGIVELGEDGDFLTFADTAQVNRYMARSGNSEFNKFFSPTPRNETGSEAGFATGPTNSKVARPGIYYEDFTARVITVKGDYTSQITDNHQIGAGLQGRFHTYDRTLRAGYIGGSFPTYQNYVEEMWKRNPGEYSLYVQDKMEYAGLIINLGLRLDALNIDAAPLANYFAPFEDVTDANGGPVRLQVRGEDKSTSFFFSPRLGVSHPISDNAAMYFSFSRQQQSQPFSKLYTNYNDFGNPSLPVITQADQDPIKSTNYDLGIQWSFAQGYGLDLSAYYKDIQNYTPAGFVVTPAAPWKLYNIVTTSGYADSRGVELTINKNIAPITDFLSIGGRVAYAYSYIKASANTGGNQTSFSTVGGDSLKYAGQLPFGDIAFYNSFERNVLGGNTTLTGGYDRAHRITYSVYFRFPYEITLSSIGTFSSGFFYTRTLADDPRARELGEAPWNKRVDLRLEKAFSLPNVGRLALYVDLVNAFNWVNILGFQSSTQVGSQVWEKSGDPTGWQGPGVAQTIRRSPVGYGANGDGLLVYDVPREVYFGLNFTLP